MHGQSSIENKSLSMGYGWNEPATSATKRDKKSRVRMEFLPMKLGLVNVRRIRVSATVEKLRKTSKVTDQPID